MDLDCDLEDLFIAEPDTDTDLDGGHDPDTDLDPDTDTDLDPDTDLDHDTNPGQIIVDSNAAFM